MIGELAELTARLREETLQIQQTVRDQNISLSSIQQYALENMEDIQKQRKAMAKREASLSRSFWGSLGSIIWVGFLFLITYLIIRIFPKERVS